MAHLVSQRGLADQIDLDSAGTSGFHVGERADSRMRDHAERRGIELTSLSRKFTVNDFDEFDYILVMDDSNYKDVMALPNAQRYAHKVQPFAKYCQTIKASYVPDPYYGGADGFEEVLDIVEDASKGFLKAIEGELS